MKIAYVIASLATQGGTERVVAEKARYLSEKFGYNVYIVCYGQRSDTPNFYTIGKNVEQINLGLDIYNHYKYKRPKRLWIKYKLRHQLKEKLSEAIIHTDPDILIGISHFRADFVCSIDCRAKIIIESHIPKSSIEHIYKGQNFFEKLYKRLYDKLYFHTIENKADKIVTLTEEARKTWNKTSHLTVIPNISNLSVVRYSNTKKTRVIAVGRLSHEKGYDRLLDIWKYVSTQYPDWHLDIYGDGVLKEEITETINSKRVPNISLQGSTIDISKEYANSSICVVTSYFEGFSLVILEAMKHGVPCVAFDCPYGPRSIIEDGKNGFLVEDGNISLFVEKLCSLIESIRLRQQFSTAALERAKFFDTDKIMLQWKSLFEDCNIRGFD